MSLFTIWKWDIRNVYSPKIKLRPNIHTITAEGPQNSDRKKRVIVVRWCIHFPFMSTNIASIICNIPYWANNSFPYSSVHRRIVNLNLLLRRSFFFSISFADRSSSPFPSIGLASNGFNFLLQENTCCAMAEVFLRLCTGCFINNVTNSKQPEIMRVFPQKLHGITFGP